MTYLLGRNDPTYRLRPGVAAGTAVLLVTLAIVEGLQFASGIPYRAWGSSDRVLVLTEIVPVAVGAVFLVAFVRWAGWDAVWRDPFPLPVARGVRTVVVIAGVVVIAHLVSLGVPAVPGSSLALLASAAVLGASLEELALRGVLLRALRVGRRPELRCALWTTLVGALLQLPVLALGSGSGLGPVSVLVATAGGALFYLVRRAARSLGPAIALHAITDLTLLLQRADGAEPYEGPLATTLAVTTAAVVLLALALTLRHDRSRPALVDPALA